MWNPFRQTHVEGLPLPTEMLELLSNRHWPINADQARPQFHSHNYIPLALVQSLASDESFIFLEPPPFKTLAQRLKGGEKFWSWPEARADLLDLNQAVLIAAFELGSDSGVILDYRTEIPCLRRLKYERKPVENHWPVVAETFAEFAEKLNLKSLRF